MKIDGRLFIVGIMALVLILGACATTISTGSGTSPSDVQAKVNKPFNITLEADNIGSLGGGREDLRRAYLWSSFSPTN